MFFKALFRKVFTAIVAIRAAEDVGELDSCLSSATVICTSLIFMNALSVSYFFEGYYRMIPIMFVPLTFYYFMTLSERPPSHFLKVNQKGFLDKLVIPYIILSVGAVFFVWTYWKK